MYKPAMINHPSPNCPRNPPCSKSQKTCYRTLFKHHLNTKIIEDIRQANHKAMAIGNEKFKDEIEKLTGTKMRPKRIGRPNRLPE